jgi:hypothetical protein
VHVWKELLKEEVVLTCGYEALGSCEICSKVPQDLCCNDLCLLSLGRAAQIRRTLSGHMIQKDTGPTDEKHYDDQFNLRATTRDACYFWTETAKSAEDMLRWKVGLLDLALRIPLPLPPATFHMRSTSISARLRHSSAFLQFSST